MPATPPVDSWFGLNANDVPKDQFLLWARSLEANTREKLTAARTYYVRTDGNDANSGLIDSAGGAFRTPQRAIDAIAALDLGTFNVTIQLKDGTWTGSDANVIVRAPWLGSGTVTLQGNATTPGNTILDGNSIFGTVCLLAGALTVQNFRFRGTMGLTVRGPARLDLGPGLEMGTVTHQHLLADGAGAIIYGRSSYLISAVSANAHIFATANSYIDVAGVTATIPGAVTFSGAYVLADRGGVVMHYAMTFSITGSVTGTRYGAGGNGVLFSNGGGANYYPGTAPGSVSTGGQYL